MSFALLAFPFTLAAAEMPTQSEALYMRRIVELWKEGEQDIARKEMRQYFQKYPTSALRFKLMRLVADEEYRQGHYKEALAYYRQLPTSELDASTEERCLDSYSRCGEYEQLVSRLQSKLPPQTKKALSNEEARRIYQYAEALAHLKRHPEAISHLERLYSTPLSMQAKLIAARSYALTDQPKQAAELYLALAEQPSDKKDDLLLQAALLQAQYDATAAAQTLERMENKAHSTGAFCQTLILFQAGEFGELWNRRETLSAAVAPEQRTQLNLYLGRSALALGLWQEAEGLIAPLSHGGVQDKVVLASLITCAQGRKQLDKASGLVNRFEAEFPTDPLLGRLLLAQAEGYRSHSQPVASLKAIERILQVSKDPHEREQAALLRVVVLSDQQHWMECHRCAEDFLASYAKSQQQLPLQKLLVRSTAGELENPQLASEERALLQERLVAELTQLMAASGGLSQEERAGSLLQLASVHYARKDLSKAKFYAQQMIEQFPVDHRVSQAYLLVAYSHYQDSDWQPFITHAEKALLLQPEGSDQDKVRLNLFGVYLQLARALGEKSEGESGNIARAADHLYAVIQRGVAEVKSDNLRWLVGFYYSNACGGMEDCDMQLVASSKKRQLAERALELQQKLPIEDSFKDRLMTSQLLGLLGRDEERKRALQAILSRPWSDVPQLPRELARVRMSLAVLMEQTGDQQGALKIYEAMAMTDRTQEPRLHDMALLRAARTKYALMRPEEGQIGNPQVQVLLQQLKDLQVRRVIAHEPVHLEAAYERAHIAAKAESSADFTTALLSNLKQAKRQILAQDDIASRDYHASREADPAKDTIFQAYLMLFDARIAQLEGELAAVRRDTSEQKAKLSAARTLYTTLLQGNFAVSKYLVSQAQSNLEQINGNPIVNQSYGTNT
jgi:TolA-binding protein